MAVLTSTPAQALRRARRTGHPIVHLLHVGKTGGTATKDVLAGSVSPTHHLVLHPHRVTLADVPVGDQVVFVLRDPVSRFVSAFHSRQREGRPRHRFPWNDAERRAFAVFGTPDQLGQALGSDEPAERAAAEQAMHGIRHVRDHFSFWFGRPADFLRRSADVLLVGRQESLAADFSRLTRLLSLPESVVLPASELGSHRTPHGYDRSLHPAARANLRRWYADDYDFLELCREHADVLGYVPPQ